MRIRTFSRSDPGGNRTHDLAVKSRLLYQLSYRVRLENYNDATVRATRPGLASPTGSAWKFATTMPHRSVAHRTVARLHGLRRMEAAGGLVLLACAIVAMAWANSPWRSGYEALWETPATFGLAPTVQTITLRLIVNDGLMAVFFFVVGLEIKHELFAGELASRRRAALPVAAAAGGMLAPALLYALVNVGGAGARGWGIPMATDIAFALGVLALLGPRIPASLRVFLSALAIADDLGAVLVIALFYSAGLSPIALGAALALLAASIGANVAGVRTPWAYAVIGVALWAAVLMSGVHATVAGVLLAFTVPSRTPVGGEAQPRGAGAPLDRLEHRLQPIVTFGIMPLFALANAGVALRGAPSFVTSPIALGVLGGLVLGKPIGICLAAWLAVRSGVASLPEGVSWRLIHGTAWLGGIGFTMSLFIAGLAFGGSPSHLATAKLATLTASVVAGTIGWLLLRRADTSRYG
jgi:Na+:H+ antiporter, NhaA family